MTIDLDADGHLVDPGAWTPEVAVALASGDGLRLEDAHWRVINFVRTYHHRYGNPPLMRTLVARLRENFNERFGSRELYRLFPDGPVRLACKYGGLPKPDWCI